MRARETANTKAKLCLRSLPDNLVVAALQVGWVVDLDGLSVEGVGGARHGASVVTCSKHYQYYKRTYYESVHGLAQLYHSTSSNTNVLMCISANLLSY